MLRFEQFDGEWEKRIHVRNSVSLKISELKNNLYLYDFKFNEQNVLFLTWVGIDVIEMIPVYWWGRWYASRVKSYTYRDLNRNSLSYYPTSNWRYIFIEYFNWSSCQNYIIFFINCDVLVDYSENFYRDEKIQPFVNLLLY